MAFLGSTFFIGFLNKVKILQSYVPELGSVSIPFLFFFWRCLCSIYCVDGPHMLWLVGMGRVVFGMMAGWDFSL